MTMTLTPDECLQLAFLLLEFAGNAEESHRNVKFDSENLSLGFDRPLSESNPELFKRKYPDAENRTWREGANQILLERKRWKRS